MCAEEQYSVLCLIVVGLLMLGVTALLSRTRTAHFSVSARGCILRAKVYTTTTVHDNVNNNYYNYYSLHVCDWLCGPLLLAAAAAAALLPLFRCCCCVSSSASVVDYAFSNQKLVTI